METIGWYETASGARLAVLRGVILTTPRPPNHVEKPNSYFATIYSAVPAISIVPLSLSLSIRLTMNDPILERTEITQRGAHVGTQISS